MPSRLIGPPHLLGARGVDRAPAAVEIEAGGVERQAEMVEHAPHLGFRIVDQPLIDDVEQCAGLDRIEMAHHPQIVAIEVADRIQAVGERHAGRVMLLEVGKAARHRVAAGIDDPPNYGDSQITVTAKLRGQITVNYGDSGNYGGITVTVH
jgi:hypothetical protein